MLFSANNDISFTVTCTFMKIVGIWKSKNQAEKRFRNVSFGYTVFLMLFGIFVQTRDFYYSRNIISECLYTVVNLFSIFLPLTKIVILFIKRDEFLSLIVYMQRNFWHKNYDETEEVILSTCRRTCTYFICVFTVCTEFTVFSFIFRPIGENYGKNQSERVLPFNMWLEFSFAESPYFEIMYTIQSITVYFIGICYFCFDNSLCTLNLHLACQFRILQYKLSNIIAKYDREVYNTKLSNSPITVEKYTSIFKSCIQQHQALIAYSKKLEDVFSKILLVQTVVFSLIICLDGFQITMDEADTTRRLIFIFHVIASTCQLLMFTYSCDCLIRESTEVATAAYAGLWQTLPMCDSGRTLRKHLVFLIMRCREPCCLTANGFFVVSLETYTKVLSTALSYFTLIQQTTSGEIE